MMPETPVFNEATKDVVKSATREAERKEGYYGLPMLKRPLWGWEIALYFFSEGISSGSYILATMADLFGSGRYASLIRNARYISLAALLPCPPLLIADLGRPERFHHMLRIFKPHSPMNMGSWALSGFSGPVGLLALTEFAELQRFPTRAVSLAGLPFAFFMLAYPGVLLATTSIPVWARTRFLGALLGASSMATAAGALAIAAALDPKSDERTREAIHRIENVTNIAEAVALSAYVYSAGPAARPLTRGRYATMFRMGAFVLGIGLPALVAVTRRKPGRAATIGSGLLSLAGALALKWSVVHAGHDSAQDAEMNRYGARADSENPGWRPGTSMRTGVMRARPSGM
jgi:formate-dependent nitrite reductase membrane component NrfD